MKYSLGIDIGSTTVKIAICDEDGKVVFSDYKRHFANIQETLAELLALAKEPVFRNSDHGRPGSRAGHDRIRTHLASVRCSEPASGRTRTAGSLHMARQHRPE